MKSIMHHLKVKKLVMEAEMKKKNRFRVAIFGSARVKKGDAVYKQVFELAKMVGEQGFDVVTGGGPGLMEAANAGHMLGDAHNKAESIGLTITLPWENKGNDFLEIRHRFKHFSNRLDTFLTLSDVMVVTKGGIGSVLELFYMWQHLQVHLSDYKPIILIGKMWETLISWMKKETLPENLVSPEDFDFIYVARNNKEAMSLISKFHKLHVAEKKLHKIVTKTSQAVVVDVKPMVKKVAKKAVKKVVKIKTVFKKAQKVANKSKKVLVKK